MENLGAEFKNHIRNLSISTEKKLLVAVSGGVDSMVLINLLLKSNLNFSVAHCNFQLRGKDSDLDESFVEEFCLKHNIEFYIKQFDVESFKTEFNYSTQMAARELRYKWFFDLIKKNKFDSLLTAHHLNDSLETFLINLSRGTGIKGLTGIQNNSYKILRPLLPFSKKEILNYANENNLQWREDETNLETEYARNKIRHEITPVLEEIHPGFLDNFSKTIQFLNSDSILIQNHIHEIREKLFQKKKDSWEISINELKKLNPLLSYLHSLFSEFGFKYPLEMEKLISSSKNGEIHSSKFRLIKNRDHLILISLIKDSFSNEIELKPNQIIEKPLYLRFSKSNFQDLNASESLDFTDIKFPLRLRKQKSGDVFFPLGMKGSKKVSKFFKDEKFSQIEKENAWILVDEDDQILYIVGKRVDERFKIKTNTHKFLNIYLC